MKTKENKSSSPRISNSRFFVGKSSGGFFAQAKLNVGKSGDKYEQEADRVAEQVMTKTDVAKPFFPAAASTIQNKNIVESITPLVQRAEVEEAQTKLEVHRQEEEEEMLQTQSMEEEEEMLQPKNENVTKESSPNTEQKLKWTRGNGNNLDADTRTQMETGFGADFSGVKIHTNSTAIQMNKELGAQAFTSGSDIYFNEGKYVPSSQTGKKLLAHELAHTVQQGASQSQTAVQRVITATTSPSKGKAIEESTNVCDESVKKAKEKFLAHGVYGPQSTKLRFGGFQSIYYPNLEDLDIDVRGKTKFINGLTVAPSGVVKSEDSDLNNLATLLNSMNDKVLNTKIVNTYYTWSAVQKGNARKKFKQRLKETTNLWEANGKIKFKVDEPCWDDIKARVGISINVEDLGNATFDEKKGETTDHIQVALVKNPNSVEKEQIKSDVKAAATRTGKADTSPDLSVTANVASKNVMTLTNTDLTEFSNFSNDYSRSSLRTDVNFGHGKHSLSDNGKKRIDWFVKNFKDGDDNPINNKVKLIGYASKSGSTKFNSQLVDKRLDSVYSYLTNRKKFTNIDSRKKQINYSDKLAENNPTVDSSRFRKVQIVVGSGQMQNTVAHEFGHVFKLDDEYVTPAGKKGSGKPRGELIAHNQMAEDIGVGGIMGNRFVQMLPGIVKSALRGFTGEGVRAEYSDNIMSIGNEVKKQHYGPFGAALSKLTGKKWRAYKTK